MNWIQFELFGRLSRKGRQVKRFHINALWTELNLHHFLKNYWGTDFKRCRERTNNFKLIKFLLTIYRLNSIELNSNCSSGDGRWQKQLIETIWYRNSQRIHWFIRTRNLNSLKRIFNKIALLEEEQKEEMHEGLESRKVKPSRIGRPNYFQLLEYEFMDWIQIKMFHCRLWLEGDRFISK